jgi:hypothetical protein
MSFRHKILAGLALLASAACNMLALTPTATPTPLPPLAPTVTPPATPAPPGPPEATLYLCGSALVEVCERQAGDPLTLYLYPDEPRQMSFEYRLDGDLDGTRYTFNIWLASFSTTAFKAELVVRQGGQESVLASAVFTAQSDAFEEFSETVSGADPSTAPGDLLILRLIHQSGDGGAVDFSTSERSFVVVPGIR